MERQTILIVDDERINLKALAELLRDEYTVLVAKSGKQALERASADMEPDLIILDVMMPDLDGYEVSRELKRNPKTANIPIIFLTALDSTTDEEIGLELGAFDYITKPIQPAIVKARIRNLLACVHQRKHFEQQAKLDALTEIPNRRRFDEMLEAEWNRSLRSGLPLGLGMIDIDYFKQYNDLNGHLKGDWVLREIALAISGRMRRGGDFTARYGGEEFAFILPNTDAKGGYIQAEAIREAIAALGIPHEKSLIADSITVSIGGYTMVADTALDPEEIVRQADALLYQSKKTGRNKVTWSSQGTD